MDRHDPRQTTTWLVRAIVYLVYAYLLVTEFILLQGFLLRLLGANVGSSYVDWAYRSLDRVMAPFRGIFEPVELTSSSVLDTSIIFAMVIYGIVALVVQSLLAWLTNHLHRLERERLLDQEREWMLEQERLRTGASAADASGAAGSAGADPSAPLPG